jgi:Pentapeptide repeats (8 copies)/HEAT repeats
MSSNPNQLELLSSQISAIAESDTDDFLELVKLAKLDPKRDFVGADLRGMNLANLDLRQFDFRGADFRGASLEGTRFTPALTSRAVFDHSRIDHSSPTVVWISGDAHPNESSSEDARVLMEEASRAPRQEDRLAALESLVNRFPSLPKLRDFLKSRAIDDAAKKPRLFAEHVLRSHFGFGREQILDILTARLIDDSRWWSYRFRDALKRMQSEANKNLDGYERLKWLCVNATSALTRSELIESLDEVEGRGDLLDFLKSRARDDQVGSPRTEALKLIRKRFGEHPGARSFYVERALEDDDEAARAEALTALGSMFDDEETRQFLAARASEDKGVSAKRAALTLLAQQFPADTETFSLVKAAAKEATYSVRSCAIDLLGSHFSENLEAFPIVLDAAANDPNEWVRLTALTRLGDHFNTQPTVEPFLVKRAQIDPQTTNRIEALEMLAKHFPRNTELPKLLESYRENIDDYFRWRAESLMRLLKEEDTSSSKKSSG